MKRMKKRTRADHQAEIDQLNRWQMKARATGQLQQLEASLGQLLADNRHWNQHVRKPDEPEVPEDAIVRELADVRRQLENLRDDDGEGPLGEILATGGEP